MKKCIPLLCFIFITSIIRAEKEITPITIDASVTTFDSTFRVSYLPTIVITGISDTSLIRKEKGIVGFSRVGRKKRAPIVCTPDPSSLLNSSLQSLFAFNNAVSDSTRPPSIAVSINILVFSISEVSKKITQTMTAEIALEVTLTDLQNGTIKQKFTVKTQNTYSTLDTSKHAGTVLKGALSEALREILKSMN